MNQTEISQYGLLRDIIQTKSYSGEEGEILASIEAHLQEHGIQTFCQKPPEHQEPYQHPNVVVHFQGKDKERALIFDGHVDTVSADENLWNRFAPFGPHAGQIEDGKMYGLGASDMKSGIFAQIKIAEHIHKNGPPPCDIWIAFVVEEETNGKGTSSFVDWFFSQSLRYKEIGVIIPEPTDLDNFFIGQRGNYALKAHVEGSTGHASQIRLDTKNSIVTMSKFIDAVHGAGEKWKNEFHDDLFGPPTVSITAVNGGDFSYPNKHAPHCEAAIDIRTNPRFHAKVMGFMEEIGGNFGITIEQLWLAGPSVMGDKTAKLVSTMVEVTSLQPSIHPATTDVGWFLDRGITQAVIYGPGHYLQSHQPSEYVSLKNIDTAIDQYKQAIELWGK